MNLTNEELDRVVKWLEDKGKPLSEYVGACGGRLTYMFTPTTLGVITKVRDNLDNTELDLTDYIDW